MTQQQYTGTFQVVQKIKELQRSIDMTKGMMERNTHNPAEEDKSEWYGLKGSFSEVHLEPRIATEVLRLILKLKEELLNEYQVQFDAI